MLNLSTSKADLFSDASFKPPRHYTLCITLQCNLACNYCYVIKSKEKMSMDTANRAIDFIFRHALSDNIEIGFFGGEPLLEFSLLEKITDLIEKHVDYSPERVSFTITTNGTIFSNEIGSFLKYHCFKTCISCDGIPEVHNLNRKTFEHNNTSHLVEETIISAQTFLPTVMVNAVFRPETFRYLPQTIDYLSSLGIRKIFINPDFTVKWREDEANELPKVYGEIANKYISWCLEDDPHYVSLLNSKLAIIMRGGYNLLERCHMGNRELTITPEGGLYPCERLIGSGINSKHQIGNIDKGIDLSLLKRHCASGDELNTECLTCSLKNWCMNWCGCSNIFMSGYYNRVGPFLCASEKAAINTAWKIFETLEQKQGPMFLHHLAATNLFSKEVEHDGNK